MISSQAASSRSPRSARKEALLPARTRSEGGVKDVQTKILPQISPNKTSPPAKSNGRRVKKNPKRETMALSNPQKNIAMTNKVGEMKINKTKISPASQKRHERQNRPSFQGLTVVEGKGKER